MRIRGMFGKNIYGCGMIGKKVSDGRKKNETWVRYNSVLSNGF